jgi:hypothetical protein
MTTSDDRVRGVVTATLTVREDGRCECRHLMTWSVGTHQTCSPRRGFVCRVRLTSSARSPAGKTFHLWRLFRGHLRSRCRSSSVAPESSSTIYAFGIAPAPIPTQRAGSRARARLSGPAVGSNLPRSARRRSWRREAEPTFEPSRHRSRSKALMHNNHFLMHNNHRTTFPT